MVGFVFYALAGILIVISIVLYLELGPYPIFVTTTAMSIAVAVIGIFLVFHENGKKETLMKELESLAHRAPICPKCSKQIPQGNYTFCPFCGSPLTPPR